MTLPDSTSRRSGTSTEVDIRAVIQRVAGCAVSVEGETIANTEEGLLVLLGVAERDTGRDAKYLADKTLNLRVFPDDSGKMNLSVIDVGGEIMVVSQFTLLADCSKGRRPSFAGAADPGTAERLYRYYASLLERSGLAVETGVFRATMSVELVNLGPVTLVLDSDPAGTGS